MNKNDPIIITRLIRAFDPPLLKGKRGAYVKAIACLGFDIHLVLIDGKQYQLREGEFEVEAAQEFDHC